MRVNLISQACGSYQSYTGTMPVTVTVRPSCGLPGDYEYRTDSASMLRLLKKCTDLPAAILDRFNMDLRTRRAAKLLAVDLPESALTDIGYFID